MNRLTKSVLIRPLCGLAAMMLSLSACTSSDKSADNKPPSDCATVDIASSPEKVQLLTDLAAKFNSSKDAKKDGCAFARVKKVSSGAGAQSLVDGWDEATNGPKPVIWTPSASSWGGVVNHRLSTKGAGRIIPDDFKSFMLTPLVVAMPKPMAEALDYPRTPLGFAEISALANDPKGWAGKGHPEWGPFKLGKTNPNFSTSALSATVATYYAAAGKTRGLTIEDLNRPEVDKFQRSIESSVVHYGDTTLTFLNNLYRSDRQGNSLSYVSAVAVEEKSVIDYNSGNPDGILDAGEQPRAPRVPLVAVYPKEGTLFSDNPLYVMNAPWVSADQKTAANKFIQYILKPDSQQQVLNVGFRPGNPQVAVGKPIGPETNTDGAQPQTTLGVPSPDVLSACIDKWGQFRKAARVLLVMDVSGSMAEEAGNGQTKLDLAKQASIDALAQFKAEDEVGLRVFSTEIRNTEPRDYVDLVPIAPIGGQREQIANKISGLEPRAGTPLFTVAQASFLDIKNSYKADRINAVLLLTDGRNDDQRNRDINAVLTSLRSGSEGQSSSPVRLFTIAYGKDADQATLKRMAEATNAASYDASNPRVIGQVFSSVVSNF